MWNTLGRIVRSILGYKTSVEKITAPIDKILRDLDAYAQEQDRLAVAAKEKAALKLARAENAAAFLHAEASVAEGEAARAASRFKKIESLVG